MSVMRRTLLTGSLGLVVGTGLTTCTRPAAEVDPGTVLTGSAPTAALGSGGAAVAGRLALALWSRAPLAVVLRAGPIDVAPVRRATDAARALRVPLLIEGPGLATTVRRLRVERVIAYPDGGGLELPGVRVTTGPATDDTADLGVPVPFGPPLPALHVLGAPPVGAAAAGTTTLTPAMLARAVGATALGRHRDPRADHETVAALRAAPTAGVLVGGDADGARLARRVRTARRAQELPIPGGGQLPLQDRVLVALYGHPQTSALGLLGEQDVEASVRRAKRRAEDFRELTELTVVPAFEIIATVASGAAGPRGDYSTRTPLSVLRPWVEAAGAAGVYCILDLQSGRADSLEQARHYEELLRHPHVGLALDPEWRLEPGGRPLQRVGHLEIEEVNRVARWLDALVAAHDLPPKVLTLHPVQTRMIRDRERLDTSLDTLQWGVHVDGQGGRAEKQATWARIREDLPRGVHLGWKNFVDEDHPMLSPQETWEQVDPHPSLVTYQ